MTLKEFINRMMTDLLNFDINMENLNHTSPMPPKKWMELYLAWTEWETDMQQEYWPEE
ncbi:hypothetical protein LCGC14_0996810 [marine sediment metagenome]|uniref:Uncharacterized protein n=1 Tax=marine sediment metagenome TaxID=412755 RepID=A0A0F9QMP9_9ZZZZ